MSRQEKPWEKLGMSRATWFRRGKPTEVAQRPDAQIYTADYGLQQTRQITRTESKTRQPEFLVARSKGKKIAAPQQDDNVAIEPPPPDEVSRHFAESLWEGLVENWDDDDDWDDDEITYVVEAA